jgi:hypothetical protein
MKDEFFNEIAKRLPFYNVRCWHKIASGKYASGETWDIRSANFTAGFMTQAKLYLKVESLDECGLSGTLITYTRSGDHYIRMVASIDLNRGGSTVRFGTQEIVDNFEEPFPEWTQEDK